MNKKAISGFWIEVIGGVIVCVIIILIITLIISALGVPMADAANTNALNALVSAVSTTMVEAQAGAGENTMSFWKLETADAENVDLVYSIVYMPSESAGYFISAIKNPSNWAYGLSGIEKLDPCTAPGNACLCLLKLAYHEDCAPQEYSDDPNDVEKNYIISTFWHYPVDPTAAASFDYYSADLNNINIWLKTKFIDNINMGGIDAAGSAILKCAPLKEAGCITETSVGNPRACIIRTSDAASPLLWIQAGPDSAFDAEHIKIKVYSINGANYPYLTFIPRTNYFDYVVEGPACYNDCSSSCGYCKSC